MSASRTWFRAGCPVTAEPPVHRWLHASAESRTSTNGSPPRRSAPAPVALPPAPRDPARSGCPVAAASHRPSGCTGTAPLRADTCLRAGRCRSLARTDRPRPARYSRASYHPRPRHRGSASPASMLRAGRHPCTRGRTAHGTVVPVAAWPPPTAVVGVLALCRPAYVGRGSWVRSCRPCPRAYLRPRHPHPRDPSLRSRCSSRPSPVLRSPRTPAAHDAFSPSAYARRSALTWAAQTGLSCSPSSLEHVLRPLPRQDSRRVLLRTFAPRAWPSPRHARLGSRIVSVSRRQASLDVAARALAPSEEALDAPLRPRRSLAAPGAC